ncbi:MAG: DedA family protein [Bacteroidaceae bacterium]|nr:DedA family protein [Bacteroidaceae bacterium]
MDFIINLLVEWGLVGMFVSAFLAGSVIPISSEAVMLTLLAAGVNPWLLFVYASVGNILGGLFNYFLGSLGKEEWIQKWTKIPPKKLNRGMKYVRQYGAWAGFLSWVPLFGEVITVALGFMRVNFWASFITVSIGKAVRYYLIMHLVCKAFDM